jgi:cyclase
MGVSVASQHDTGALEVAAGVYAFIQPGGATDAGFIVDRDGVVIIDTLMTASLANQLLAEVRRVTDAPIRHIINTHWHGDHVFGNAVLPHVPIIAHDTCREDLLAEWDGHRAFLRDLYPALWPEMEQLEATPPDITFETKATLHLASRSVELMFLGRAHTRGDVVAYLPDVGVAFAGDLAFHKYIPNARDGFPADWITAASRLEELGADIIVPGHGPLGTNAELHEMRECLELVVGQVRQSYEAGLTEEQARDALQLGPFADWGRQEDRLPGVVRRAYMELRGDL